MSKIIAIDPFFKASICISEGYLLWLVRLMLSLLPSQRRTIVDSLTWHAGVACGASSLVESGINTIKAEASCAG